MEKLEILTKEFSHLDQWSIRNYIYQVGKKAPVLHSWTHATDTKEEKEQKLKFQHSEWDKFQKRVFEILMNDHIQKAAYFNWLNANKPESRDLEFWIAGFDQIHNNLQSS